MRISAVVVAACLAAATNGRSNWSNNVHYCAGSTHCKYAEPRTEDEVRAIVQEAEQRDAKVHVVGTRHSFSTVADVPLGGVHIGTGKLSAIGTLQLVENLSADVLRNYGVLGDTAAILAVEPGATYNEVGEHLFREGLALRNYASLPHISIGGAVSTWTHGSGVEQGSLSTHVLGLRIVSGGGKVTELLRGRDDDFLGSVVAIGGMGVVTKLYLDTVQAFDVAQCVYPQVDAAPFLEQNRNAAPGTTAEVRPVSILSLMASAYSTSLFIDYGDPGRFSSVWRKIRVSEGGSPRRNAMQRVWGTAELMGGAAHGGCDQALPVASLPAVPPGEAFHPVPEQPAHDCTPAGVEGPGHWRLPHFRPDGKPSAGGDELQSEFFIRMHQVEDAIRALTAPEVATVLAPLVRVTEVRAIAPDEHWLSPCRRLSGTPESPSPSSEPCVGLHFTWMHDLEGVHMKGLPAVLHAIKELRPVPHLGKVAGLHDAEVGRMYEERTAGGVSRFARLRNRFDPKGTFVNEFLAGFLEGASASGGTNPSSEEL